MIVALFWIVAGVTCSDDPAPQKPQPGVCILQPLSEQLESAQPGDVIEAEACVHPGPVVLPAGVTLKSDSNNAVNDLVVIETGATTVALTVNTRAGQVSRVEGITVRSTGEVAVLLTGGGHAELSEVTIESSRNHGLVALGLSELTFDDVRISGTVASSQQSSIGLLFREVASFTLKNIEITGFASIGALITNSSGSLSESLLGLNGNLGLMVYGQDSRVSLDHVSISSTRSEPCDNLVCSFGLVVTGGAALKTNSLELVGNQGIGLFQSYARSYHSDLKISGNHKAGIWLQDIHGKRCSSDQCDWPGCEESTGFCDAFVIQGDAIIDDNGDSQIIMINSQNLLFDHEDLVVTERSDEQKIPSGSIWGDIVVHNGIRGIVCLPGFYGPDCESECVGGAEMACLGNGICKDNLDGDGSCICQLEYTGPSCDLCSSYFLPYPQCWSCIPGIYGSDCDHECPGGLENLCNSNGDCHDGLNGSGQCSCDSRFDGDACDECAPGFKNYPHCDECLDGFYGPSCEVCPGEDEPCGEHGDCDDGITGSGLCRCDDGFDGDLCDHCLAGFFSVLCEPCPGEDGPCGNHGICEDGMEGGGTCQCIDRFQGDACEECSEDFWGPECESCPGGLHVCNDQGDCSDGIDGDGKCECYANFSGEVCDQCADGFFGPSCESCPEENEIPCSGIGICNDGLYGDGLCVCPVGFGGLFCEQDFCIYCDDSQNCQPGSCCSSGICSAPMVPIEAGFFMMGCNEVSDGMCGSVNRPEEMDREFSLHEVSIQPFFIDLLEVSQFQYKVCVEAGVCSEPDVGGTCNNDHEDRLDHPVNCVDWEQSRNYCEWAGKRLCSEAEWEFAARGSDGAIYPWGSEYPTCQYTVMDSGGVGCGLNHTDRVGTRSSGRNPFGVFDLSGNVFEWVEDDYHETYTGAPTGSSAWIDEPRGALRIFRGGGFGSGFIELRASYRDFHVSNYRHGYIGFRCCKAR